MFNPFMQPQMPVQNPFADLINRFNQFRQSITGDPRQQVQNLLNSGRVTQQQYNQAVQIANQMKNVLNIK